MPFHSSLVPGRAARGSHASKTAVFVLLGATFLSGCDSVVRVALSPEDRPDGQSGASVMDLPSGALEVVVEGLETPWDLAFLPNGDMLVTERPGRLTRISGWEPGGGPVGSEDGSTWTLPGVQESGEGGLLGLAVHPAFSESDPSDGSPDPDANQWVYLMFTTQGAIGLENRVRRYRLTGQGPLDPVTIIDGIPGGRVHDGGRIRFGPDGYLYIGTGEAGEPSRSQDLASLAGKILRVDEEGRIPPGNPFGSAVWSWGHRNPQGMAWDEQGRLWSTEHGRSGLRSGLDELNLVVPGTNYGWPTIEGDGREDDLAPPVVHSGETYTWAPGGVAVLGERLFFGGLRGQALYEVILRGDSIEGIVAHFASELGRIRAVVRGPDGALYLATSNRDGRGTPRSGDDRILRLDPSALSR
jgi:glucose/arabinose dehydrogenase